MAEISHYPQRSGIIYGFSYGDPYFIGDVLGDLRLESPLEFWLWVSHKIKELKMSEPTVDFIILLDMLKSGAVSAKRLPRTIAEFSCNDEVQMRTYSDLLSKLYAANPGTDGPVKTDKIFSAAKDYLACCYIEAFGQEVFVSSVGNAERKAIEAGCRVTEKHCFGDLELAFGEKIPPRREKSNDVICMICSDDEKAVRGFLSHMMENGTVKRVARVEKGLLETLLTFSEGLDITAHRTDGMTYPLAQICTGFAGCWLVRIAPDDLYAVQMEGVSRGISVSPVATVNRGNHVGFSFPGGAYRINSQFISEVLASPYEDAAGLAEPMPLRVPSFDDLSYSEGSEDCYLSDDICTGCEYYDASAAVVSAVSKAVADGHELKNIRLTNLITYDENHALGNLPSRLVSHMLGLYRAQIELCLPDMGSAFEVSCANKTTVIATAVDNRTESCVKSGTVYLATPTLSEDGFPDYGELRRIFRFVFGAVTTGKCKAVVIDARGAQNALQRLCGETCVDVSEIGYLPGAFLLLTEEKIEGLAALGYFEGKAESMVLD